jgi:hypothetical protein
VLVTQRVNCADSLAVLDHLPAVVLQHRAHMVSAGDG